MKKLDLKAYAKINLAIDVLGTRPDGYHDVEMVMQQIALHDKVCVKWIPGRGENRGVGKNIADGSELGKESAAGDVERGEKNSAEDEGIIIETGSDRKFLPSDRRNLAYRAAELIVNSFDIYKKFGPGKVRVDMKKQIPVGAGLGGGSADCAAVLHALSVIWGLGLSVSELCSLGAALGADVPFCVMGQARLNRKELGYGTEKTGFLSACALAGGTGTDIKPIFGIKYWLVLSKPPISVSTADVYKGFDTVEGDFARPDIKELARAMRTKKITDIEKNMINVLENFAIKAYPSIMYTKNKMITDTAPVKTIMSGSGPTVIGFYENRSDAENAYAVMSRLNRETFLTKTVI